MDSFFYLRLQMSKKIQFFSILIISILIVCFFVFIPNDLGLIDLFNNKFSAKKNFIERPIKAAIFTPNSSVKFAEEDILKIPEMDQKNIRYLSLYNIPEKERDSVLQSVSFMCNSLSTRRKIYKPFFVEDSENTVIRLKITDYDWNPKTWDELAKKGSGPRRQPEPYFNYFQIKESKIKKGIMMPDLKIDKEKGPEIFKEHIEEVIEASFPSWIEKDNYSNLKKLTESNTPILRADWFLSNVCLPPFYYDFLQLGKNDKSFTDLIFADDSLAKKARSKDKGIVSISSVSRNNRTLIRNPTFTGGYYWFAHDSKHSVNNKNHLNNILNEEFDAINSIGSLPNGLQAYFTSDSKGNRLDFVDPDISIDNTSVDKIVRTARSCIICHSEGIKQIEDDVRSLKISFSSFSRPEIYELEDLYNSDLEFQINKDQSYYALSVKRATNLTSLENSLLFSKIYNYYSESFLNKESISIDCGIPLSDLERYVKSSNDPVILNLIAIPVRPIRRDQWERSYQNFMNIIFHK